MGASGQEQTRTTITFTEPQMIFLEQEAARLGISLGEVVRRIIDQHREPTIPIKGNNL